MLPVCVVGTGTDGTRRVGSGRQDGRSPEVVRNSQVGTACRRAELSNLQRRTVLRWEGCRRGAADPAAGVEVRSAGGRELSGALSGESLIIAVFVGGLGDSVGTDERAVTACWLGAPGTLGVCCL